QDFGEREWAFVEGLAPTGTPVLAFGDTTQQVLAHAAFDASRFHVKLELRSSYRTPEPLLDLARAIQAGGPLRPPDSPHVRVERVAGGPDAVADGVRRALKWLVQRKVEARDIAVLSLASTRRMTPLPVGEDLAGLPTARADDEAAPDAVVIDTVIRFKGLERPWVVLIDLDETASPEGKTRAFIGITRATMGLVMVVG
ncbi:MAG: ATP-binding domain-containing protein, partial [Polyangiaceae bacterium]|nr:ATP-binding domain-containing protein [Polyangiaceae bacterium]